MHIKKYSCNRFGGLKNTKIEFEDGLNVILGPNEAGKSTIVNGIYSTMFKESKLGKRKSKDKEFYKKFIPYPNGDSCDGSVHVDHDGESYRVNKEWGSNNKAILKLSDDSIIKKEKQIKERLNDLLEFGEGTYRNIVFARQSDIKDAIQRILEDSDTTQSISAILRRAVMELDGLSIEKLRFRIEDEIDSLLKRWDYENSRPENNKDIHNPYKNGRGEILEAYYRKRYLERDMEETEEMERNFEEISKRIRSIEEEISEKTEEFNRLSKLEGDVLKRAQLTPQIESLNERFVNLKDLNRRWPVEETNLKNNKDSLRKLNERFNALDEEYRNAKKVKELKELKNIINRVDTKKEELNKYLEKKKVLPYIKESDVLELDRIKSNIEKNKAAIEAGTLFAKLNNLQNKEIWITKGLEERQKISSNLEFEFNGFLKLEIENGIEIEIKSGEIDFDFLSQQYNELRVKFNNKLEKMKVKNIDKARSIMKELKEIEKHIEMRENHINELLQEHNYDNLKKRLEELKNIGNARTIEEIEREKSTCNSEIIKLQSDVNHIEKQIKEWEDKYKSHNDLTDNMVEIMSDMKLSKRELKKLKPLPEEFNSTDEFKDYLSKLGVQLNSLNTQLSQNKEEFFKLENNLPDISYEELKEEHTYAQRAFNNLLKKADNLLKIRDKFFENLELMGNHSFKPLEESFNKYVSKLTKGRYSIGNIDGDFDIRLKTLDKVDIPIDLLSTGTYDSISLAFRFAILENIYKDNKGLVVLDDCLVDLDPQRKKEAVDIIKEFAKNNQVIFTTCDPNTADLLGENIIKI